MLEPYGYLREDISKRKLEHPVQSFYLRNLTDKYAQNSKEGSVAAPERRGKEERMRSRKASDQ